MYRPVWGWWECRGSKDDVLPGRFMVAKCLSKPNVLTKWDDGLGVRLEGSLSRDSLLCGYSDVGYMFSRWQRRQFSCCDVLVVWRL